VVSPDSPEPLPDPEDPDPWPDVPVVNGMLGGALVGTSDGLPGTGWL